MVAKILRGTMPGFAGRATDKISISDQLEGRESNQLLGPDRSSAASRRGDRMNAQNVRYWHKADIPSCTAHVRFWG